VAGERADWDSDCGSEREPDKTESDRVLADCDKPSAGQRALHDERYGERRNGEHHGCGHEPGLQRRVHRRAADECLGIVSVRRKSHDRGEAGRRYGELHGFRVRPAP
jgi:hypothetical protein